MKTTASTKLSDVEPDENRKDEKEDFGEKTAVPGKDQECQTEDLEQKTEKKMGSKLELETEDPEAVEHEDDVRSGKDDQKTATVEELRGFQTKDLEQKTEEDKIQLVEEADEKNENEQAVGEWKDEDDETKVD